MHKIDYNKIAQIANGLRVLMNPVVFKAYFQEMSEEGLYLKDNKKLWSVSNIDITSFDFYKCHFFNLHKYADLNLLLEPTSNFKKDMKTAIIELDQKNQTLECLYNYISLRILMCQDTRLEEMFLKFSRIKDLPEGILLPTIKPNTETYSTFMYIKNRGSVNSEPLVPYYRYALIENKKRRDGLKWEMQY